MASACAIDRGEMKEDAVGAELEADEAENSGQLAPATAELAPESEKKGRVCVGK
jgi:hypothetical protein